MSFAAAMLIGLSLDAFIGWPDALFRKFSHPVVWIGSLISWLEKRLNRGLRRQRVLSGAATVLLVLMCVWILAWLVARVIPNSFIGTVLLGVLAWPWIAAHSLSAHVRNVADPLLAGDLDGARQAIAMIVGRDPTRLDSAGMSRASIESLAENCSDGVVAPIFWGALMGLPGIAIYKAINTMDSMIGHRSERYEYFGKVAAILDDVANWVPARLTGFMFAIASKQPVAALQTMWNDAPHHRSPNAGWPESAMAAVIGIRLSGPRIYENSVSDEPWLNADAPDPDAASIMRALSHYWRSMALLALALLVVALL